MNLEQELRGRRGRVPPIAKGKIDDVMGQVQQPDSSEPSSESSIDKLLKDIRTLLLIVAIVIPVSLYSIAFLEWFWLYFIFPEIMFG